MTRAMNFQGRWKPEMDDAVEMVFVGPKLYTMRSAEGVVKQASRGVSRSDNYLSFSAYKEAIFRPLVFAKMLAEAGVRVSGPGRIDWIEERQALSPLFTYTQSQPKDAKLERINEVLRLWLQGKDEKGETKEGLFVTNFSIQSLPGARHSLASFTSRKKIFSGNFIKRIVLEDGITTIPLRSFSSHSL